VSDIDTAAADSLKVLDPNRPIREADIASTFMSTRPSSRSTRRAKRHGACRHAMSILLLNLVPYLSTAGLALMALELLVLFGAAPLIVPLRLAPFASNVGCNPLKNHSLSPPKADIRPGDQDVCFGPQGDKLHRSKTLFDHLVGGHLNDHGHVEAKRLRSLEVERELEFGGLQHR
jgi:hypothetical protein